MDKQFNQLNQTTNQQQDTNKKQQQHIQLGKVKRRGTIKLQQSKGPPQGFYQPQYSILTIGDGDLSFSTALSQWLQYKYHKNCNKFVATTYDSLEQLQMLYKLNVLTNIKKLKQNNVQIYHTIDVNYLNKQQIINLLNPKHQAYDRIIWNFPHAGFPQKSYGPGFQWQQNFHQKHIKVIASFFVYAHLYLKKNGLILMAHKTIPPFSIWNIVGIAQNNGYKLVKSFPFNIDDYPGYENRRGVGKNGAKRFPIQDAVQYVFKQIQGYK